jgi:hypothetical protein
MTFVCSVRNPEIDEARRAEVSAVFDDVVAQRKQEKRPDRAPCAWGPGETVEKIRELLPGFTTWAQAKAEL